MTNPDSALLCKKCSADGATCEECSFYAGKTSDGGCAPCMGAFCSSCKGDEPSFCLACGDWNNEALTREGHGTMQNGMYATADGRCQLCPGDDWCGKGAGVAAGKALVSCICEAVLSISCKRSAMPRHARAPPPPAAWPAST